MEEHFRTLHEAARTLDEQQEEIRRLKLDARYWRDQASLTADLLEKTAADRDKWRNKYAQLKNVWDSGDQYG